MVLDTMRMRYFVKIAQLGSLTRAANELHVAQSALSVHMRALEEQLGTQLLDRTSRGVTLTEAGETLLTHSRSILRAIEQAEHATRDQGVHPSGDVVLGMIYSLFPVLGIPVLEECKRRFPRIRLAVSEGDSKVLRAALDNRSYDLAVTLAKVATPSAVKLFEEPLYVVGPPGYFSEDQAPMPLVEALGLSLILPPQGHGTRIALESNASMLGVQPNIAWSIEGLMATKSAIQNGFGFSILARGAVYADVLAGLLSCVKISNDEMTRLLVLDMPVGHPPTRAVLEVRKVILEVVQKKGREGHWTCFQM
jgi:LysR family nitrogen assimilation transcriptional regulator